MKRLVLLICAACNGADPCPDSPTGSLAFTAYGENYIEEAIPASDVVDGWTITFQRFLLHVGAVTAARQECGGDLDARDGWVLDLAQASGGEGHELLSATVPAGTYRDVSYRVGPASAQSALRGASAADRALLAAEGWSVFVDGTAQKGADTVTFTWGFATDTLYGPCAIEAEVSEGASTPVELTIHGDHLFYDMLVDPEPNVAFDLIASADAGDGHVTREELAAKSILAESRYQTGGANIDDLDAYVEALVHTLGHINGEGHCGE